MDTDKSNSQSQSERDKINEQLDELRKKQQERNAKKKPRSRFGRLLGLLGIGGALLCGTACKPKSMVTCYMICYPDKESETEKSLQEYEQFFEKVKQESQQNKADSKEEQMDDDERQKEE